MKRCDFTSTSRRRTWSEPGSRRRKRRDARGPSSVACPRGIFGSIEAMKDDCRRVRGLRITDELGAWLNIPLWALRSAPGNGNQEETTYGEHRGPRDGAIPRGPGRL